MLVTAKHHHSPITERTKMDTAFGTKILNRKDNLDYVPTPSPHAAPEFSRNETFPLILCFRWNHRKLLLSEHF